MKYTKIALDVNSKTVDFHEKIIYLELRFWISQQNIQYKQQGFQFSEKSRKKI